MNTHPPTRTGHKATVSDMTEQASFFETRAWTYTEVAAYLRVSRRQVERLVSKGLLPAHRLPSVERSEGKRPKPAVRFIPSEIVAWLGKQKGASAR